MAGPGDDSDERGEETHAPRECMACRGSGSVISNLGGTPSTVTCPWCRGTGTRIADVDAQASWGEQAGAAAGEPADATAEAEPPREASGGALTDPDDSAA